jgi:hypothetical protein
MKTTPENEWVSIHASLALRGELGAHEIINIKLIVDEEEARLGLPSSASYLSATYNEKRQ